MNLGPLVNTTAGERSPEYVVGAGDGPGTLYFNRGNLALAEADLYAVTVSRHGEPLGMPELLTDLSVPGANDAAQSVRTDGREILFWSDRPGTVGGADIWLSTRRSGHDRWSPPVNIGSVINTEFAEERPSLSHDGRTLLFDSFRPGGMAGSQDIWMSTRTPGGDADDAGHGDLGFSDWSDPVNLGPAVNSDATDLEVAISADERSLYVASSRSGNFDIWVSQRATRVDPWGPAENLGPTINTPVREQAPFLTHDGHRLYFFSDRLGGAGGTDLYVARRRDKHDDFGWQEPVNLGTVVNSEANETLPVSFEDAATGTTTLYFTSNRSGSPDIYASVLQLDETFGPAVRVEELSSTRRDRLLTVRRDGLEIFLASDRPGPAAATFDLWSATRANTSVPWSPPVKLGPIVNTAAGDESGAALSRDGTTLYFTSDRPGSLGIDVWVTTRTKIKGRN